MHDIICYGQGQECESTHCCTVYPAIVLFMHVLPLIETEKVALLLLLVMQFHFYETLFLSRTGIVWSL
jgi:hypothetical protein